MDNQDIALLLKDAYGGYCTGERHIFSESIEKIMDRDAISKSKRGDKYPNPFDSKDAKREDFYFHYIPYNLNGFLRAMGNFREHFPQYLNFIDVGCGAGDKCLLAKEILGYNVTGIEYSPYTYKIAKRIGKKYNFPVIHGDAFDHDFSGYNFIYLYVPIQNSDLMLKLCAKILIEMKDGIYFDIAGNYLNGRYLRKIGLDINISVNDDCLADRYIVKESGKFHLGIFTRGTL